MIACADSESFDFTLEISSGTGFHLIGGDSLAFAFALHFASGSPFGDAWLFAFAFCFTFGSAFALPRPLPRPLGLASSLGGGGTSSDELPLEERPSEEVLLLLDCRFLEDALFPAFGSFSFLFILVFL